MPTEESGGPNDGAGGTGRALRRHGWRLALLFGGLLLPLWGFAALADGLSDGEPFAFDVPLLQLAQATASERLDAFWVLVTRLGYERGVVPVDLLLVALLLLVRRWREAAFSAIALGGSALLNVAAKHAFARDRPDLWTSIAPEYNFSFPSGHAMGSMTLAWVLLLLAWPTRWRWPVLVAMAVFVPLVGWSRMYLGVHYPSDILAGWTAASAWAVGTWLAVYGHDRLPWMHPRREG